MKLNQSFFNNKSTLYVAEELLGKVLVYQSEQGILKGIINETEAYTQDEASCHAYGGKKTKRNEVMFYPAGYLYVYFTYGMHHCINVVTAKEGRAEAVLIRSIIPLQGKDIMLLHRKGNKKHLADGPAKLAIAYGFNKSHNGTNLLDMDSDIYLENLNYQPLNVKQTNRIGISQAKDLLWRFICQEFK